MAIQATAKGNVADAAPIAHGRQSIDRSVWYSGWLLTFLATAEETQGGFALIEAVAGKGNVPPPHIHQREEETFYVLEGEMTFFVGDRTIKATPGTMVIVPRRTLHSFVIESDRVRMLTLLTPAGMEGWFKEFSVPAPSMTLPPPADVPYSEIEKMMAQASKFGIEFIPPKEARIDPNADGSSPPVGQALT
jgi:quercetin dioxygenase-like cupin family protein